MTDFVSAMGELKTRMLKEDGPYGLRRSSITFAKWVVTAGGVIRGTKRFFFLVFFFGGVFFLGVFFGVYLIFLLLFFQYLSLSLSLFFLLFLLNLIIEKCWRELRNS